MALARTAWTGPSPTRLLIKPCVDLVLPEFPNSTYFAAGKAVPLDPLVDSVGLDPKKLGHVANRQQAIIHRTHLALATFSLALAGNSQRKRFYWTGVGLSKVERSALEWVSRQVLRAFGSRESELASNSAPTALRDSPGRMLSS